METISGKVSDEDKELIDDLVESGRFDSYSDFVRFAARYTLSEKYGE